MVDGSIQSYHSPFLMQQNEQEYTKLSALDKRGSSEYRASQTSSTPFADASSTCYD